MFRVIAQIALAGILSGLVFGQSADSPPKFTAAEIHVSPHSDTPSVRGGYVRNGRYELRSATMVDLVARAYGLDDAYVLSGPSWLDTDRFDLIQAGVNGQPGGADPNGGISIFEAMEKQLGLKLQTRKQPVPVLVIDHVEQRPLDN